MYTSLPYQLHSEDRNSMLHSIESRLPFLDFDLANFMLSLPDSMKLENGTTKRILRNAFKDKLQAKLLTAIKRWDLWRRRGIIKKHPNAFRSNLKETVDTLAEIVSPKIISELDHFIDGKVPYDKKFFRLFSFQSWSDIFLKMDLKTMSENSKICSRCVDTTDTKIVFDQNGICNHCHNFDLNAHKIWMPNNEGKNNLDEIIQKIKKKISEEILIA